MFTSEEIQASVQKFLVAEVASARTPFGLRNTVAMKEGVFDLLATVFLLDPSSFFALVKLAANRASALILTQISAGEALQDALLRVNKQAVPIASTSELFNAKAALLNTNAAASRRDAGFTGGVSPAVERFRRATAAFVRAELAPNVVESGVVGTTAAASRKALADALPMFATRHAQITEALSAIQGAVPALAALRLPDHLMQQVMQRAQVVLTEITTSVDAGDGLAISRQAMLDILAMRMAVTKAASFAAPLRQKAPQGSDATTLTLSSADTPASVLGSVSGPFTYDSLVAKTLAVTVGELPPSVGSLPEGSNARLLGYPTVSFPWAVSPSIPIAVRLNGGALALALPVDTYADVAALAAALDLLTGDWDVAEVGGLLQFSSVNSTDNSSIEFLGFPESDLAFLTDIAVQPWYAGTQGVEAADVATHINTYAAGFIASVDTTDYGTFSGDVLSGAPSTIVGAFDASGVPVGARVRLTAKTDYRNNGVFRVSSGLVGQLVLDRSLPTPGDSVAAAVATEFLRLSSTGTGPTDTLATPASDGATIFGFAPETAIASATGATTDGVDLQLRGVVPGDILRVPGGADQVVTAVDSVSVQFTPGIPYQANPTFTVTSAAYEAWEALAEVVSVLFADATWATFPKMHQLLGLRAQGQGARVTSALASYLGLLAGAQSDLQALQAPASPSLRSALQMLREQGMDRARDRLLTLDLEGFFTEGPDAVSYSTHLTRSLADTTREIMPTSKYR